MERVERMMNELIDYGIATSDEVSLVTTINGYNEDAMYDILYVRTGERTFEFEEDEE